VKEGVLIGEPGIEDADRGAGLADNVGHGQLRKDKGSIVKISTG
jgi:hypothetical protein